MAYKEYIKDPDAKLDYTVRWTDWLDTDTIASSTWTIPSGITSESPVSDTTTATIWLSGGTAGQIYICTNRITTAGGRTDERSIAIRVLDQ